MVMVKGFTNTNNDFFSFPASFLFGYGATSLNSSKKNGKIIDNDIGPF